MNNKKKVIAICGKSASGKDTVARALLKRLSTLGYDVGKIISNTTRVPRKNEVNGVDYNFLSRKKFLEEQYLEIDRFNGRWYGTPMSALRYEYNIGVFSPSGIVKLQQHPDISVYIIYLKVDIFHRLIRSIKREKKICFEFLRRSWYDYKDFKPLESYLTFFDNWSIIYTYKPINDIVNICINILLMCKFLVKKL